MYSMHTQLYIFNNRRCRKTTLAGCIEKKPFYYCTIKSQEHCNLSDAFHAISGAAQSDSNSDHQESFVTDRSQKKDILSPRIGVTDDNECSQIRPRHLCQFFNCLFNCYLTPRPRRPSTLVYVMLALRTDSLVSSCEKSCCTIRHIKYRVFK